MHSPKLEAAAKLATAADREAQASPSAGAQASADAALAEFVRLLTIESADELLQSDPQMTARFMLFIAAARAYENAARVSVSITELAGILFRLSPAKLDEFAKAFKRDARNIATSAKPKLELVH